MPVHQTPLTSTYSTSCGARSAVAPPWKRLAESAGLMDPNGRLSSTIFEEMSALAVTYDAINLGQGFPDTDGPDVLAAALDRAVSDGKNQYSTIAGAPELRAELAEHESLHGRRRPDADSEITITAGATEALTASMLAFLSPGDEIILFEPFYDLYPAIAGLTGAEIVTVPLLPPTFDPDPERLRAAFTERTCMVVVNDPHNPTGKVFDPKTMSLIAELAAEKDAIILTDSVYEHLAFDRETVDPASLETGRDRTIRVSSASKTFSITGWRVGWAVAPPELTRGLRVTKGYLSHSAAAPAQWAVAQTMRWARQTDFYAELKDQYLNQRQTLLEGLTGGAFNPVKPEGTFFAVASTENVPASWGKDGIEIAETLPANAGVAVVPLQAFATPQNRHLYADWVRFAFCKRPDVLREATEKLGTAGL
ncbi:aminotransferase class I/II-fold pyridoxal phosphate-dependent enzyme [Rothia uropygialis]|uniref:aminotransferase class I/II-fold pyridoxal phosphate-dependent enzyme n=1 Tax=Kocuria sp. 36 TaxID=1415402 RepID=UPI00101DF947|nr:aminotransferase class I/II-fold pyridoxal phosphate-dependent enzyme [Kocuria sp. 36]